MLSASQSAVKLSGEVFEASSGQKYKLVGNVHRPRSAHASTTPDTKAQSEVKEPIDAALSELKKDSHVHGDMPQDSKRIASVPLFSTMGGYQRFIYLSQVMSLSLAFKFDDDEIARKLLTIYQNLVPYPIFLQLHYDAVREFAHNPSHVVYRDILAQLELSRSAQDAFLAILNDLGATYKKFEEISNKMLSRYRPHMFNNNVCYRRERATDVPLSFR